MIYLPNNKLPIIKSSLLTISKIESIKYISISNNTTKAEFKLIEILLKEASIEEYSFSYLFDNFSDKFLLSYIFLSYYLLCNQKYTSDNIYII